MGLKNVAPSQVSIGYQRKFIIAKLTKKLVLAYHLVAHLGVSWAMYRAFLSVGRRMNFLERRFPIADWSASSMGRKLTNPHIGNPENYFRYRREEAPAFFFHSAQKDKFAGLLRGIDGDDLALEKRSEGVLSGYFRYFSNGTYGLGEYPDWHLNPESEVRAPSKLHWSKIGDFAYGDIKLVWEVNRFAFVYDLVRAYWRTGNEQLAERFWKLLANWREENPPNSGANWKCGQEVALRTMACCFGLYGFLHSPQTTPARVWEIANMLHRFGERIEGHIHYALSQRNNHSIGEAAGLWTIGVLFPEFKESSVWESKGRRYLEELGCELIYSDGTFTQFSLNYHRVMLDYYTWAIRLAEVQKKPFSEGLRSRVAKAVRFLQAIVDPESGAAPCFGHNDGASVLPLSETAFDDYRASVGAAAYLENRRRLYASGSWDESLLWLFGVDSLRSTERTRTNEDLKAAEGGYYAFKGKQSMAFVHCASFRERPAQADLLHADVWMNGSAVTIDPGTFSYNAPPPWDNALGRTGVHNSVTVDGLDQMSRASRFMWLPWIKGTTVAECRREMKGSQGSKVTYWQGTHNGYERLEAPVYYHRAIINTPNDDWIVLDRLVSREPHQYSVNWLFGDKHHSFSPDGRLEFSEDEPCRVVSWGVSEGMMQASAVVGDSQSTRGWRSRFYSEKEPALSIEVSVEARRNLFWTCFLREQSQVRKEHDRIVWVAGGQSLEFDLDLSEPNSAIVSRIVGHGVEDFELTVLREN